MGAALDQPFLMELVQHPNQRNRLYVQPSRYLGLANALVARNVEHDCRLLARDRQPYLPRAALEPPLDQPRDVMHEKAEGAADFGPAPLGPAVRRLTSGRWRMQHITRRHDGSPQAPVSGHPKVPPGRGTGDTDARPSGQTVRDRGR